MKSNLFFDDIIFDLQRFGGISEYWRQLTNSSVIRECFNIEHVGRLKAPTNVNKSVAKFISCDVPDKPNSVFHSSYYRLPSKNVPSIVTVHDFIYEKRSSGITKFLNSYQIRKSIRSADSIVCISNSTKNDLLDLMPEIDEQRVDVVYHGVDHSIFNHSRNLQADYMQYSDCVVFVGKRSGYKNFTLAVAALTEFKEMRLLIVGEKITQGEREALDKALGNRWVCLQGISNQELASVYRHCFCLLYPSDYEGFGMPLIEAMASGCPIITSGARALVEVGGAASLKSDNGDIDSYLHNLKRVSADRDVIIESGLEHAQKFHWDFTAKKMLSIYQNYE